MSLNLQAVIDAAADEADTVLDGVATPAEAKPLLREWLAENHPALTKTESDQVIAGTLRLLDREGFFAVADRGDGWDEPGDGAEPDE